MKRSRSAAPAVHPVLLEGHDELKVRARAKSLRAIRYSNGHVRFRPLSGGTPTDFVTQEMAEDYLDELDRQQASRRAPAAGVS